MARKLPRGIDQRTDGQYRARVYWHGRQHSIGSFFTLGDAKAALAIARSEMARKVFVPPSEQRQATRDVQAQATLEATTVGEWAEEWLARLADAGRSPGTVRAYRSTLNVHVLPTIGDRRLIDVTRADIDRLLDPMRARRSVYANTARTLRAMFAAAISADVGGLTTSPVRVSIPKDSRASDPIDGDDLATPAEVRKMAEVMPAHLRIAVPLAAWCSLRVGELLGLQRRDLEHLDDPARAVLHVRRQWNTKATPPGYTAPKAGSRRSVAIPELLLAPLAEHIATHAGPGRDGPLLPSTVNPAAPVSQTAFDKHWRAARDQVRPGFRFHSLRHTGLTEYARAGATLEELKRRGGHTDAMVALRYQHATAERDRALTARLSATVHSERTEQ